MNGRKNRNIIYEAYQDSISFKPDVSIEDLSAQLQAKIEAKTNEAANITKDIRRYVLLDSIDINLKDFASTMLGSLPLVKEGNEGEVSLLYIQDGRLLWTTFEKRLVIGRNKQGW